MLTLNMYMFQILKMIKKKKVKIKNQKKLYRKYTFENILN